MRADSAGAAAGLALYVAGAGFALIGAAGLPGVPFPKSQCQNLPGGGLSCVSF